MSLIHNEQTKLTATFLNGVALATFAVGSLGPVVAAILGGALPAGAAALVAAGCFALAMALHSAARRVLRRLQP